MSAAVTVELQAVQFKCPVEPSSIQGPFQFLVVAVLNAELT
jgi:hypothetical protein